MFNIHTWDSPTKLDEGDAADASVTWSFRRDFREERGRSPWLLLAGLDDRFVFSPAASTETLAVVTCKKKEDFEQITADCWAHPLLCLSEGEH